MNLLGSGTIFREILEAASLLKEDFNVDSTIFSIPGVNQLHNDGIEVDRYNLTHPEEKKKNFLSNLPYE